MATLRLVLGDQLSHNLASLSDIDCKHDIVVMAEVFDEATYVKHHPKKIAFIFSAMRHFAEELRQKGIQVDYYQLDDQTSVTSITEAIEHSLKQHSIDKISLTHPGEWRVLSYFKEIETRTKCPVTIHEDNRFLCSIESFKSWAHGRKNFLMEFFYREMRKRYDVLMSGNKPIGDKWNYDAENREKPDPTIKPPKPYMVEPDGITQDVLQMVEEKFSDHFGDLHPFHLATTTQQATKALDIFIDERLPLFGKYQDAMIEGEPWMYHSHISTYLNAGLLDPSICIEKAIEAYESGHAPLNAVEGFIRQILGWREYVRGIYWMLMPEYAERNALNANQPLPDFFWTGDTKMNCLKQCIKETKENGYAHHIQRLMVLGNFALLAGLDPKAVNEWYLIVYTDAYEWVELPNVSGMILFADGGELGSKPYAASGSYINKMSNYCKGCAYKVSKKNGEDACPFNYLYWDFMLRHQETFKNNHRMQMTYRTLSRFSEEKIEQIQTDTLQFFAELT